MYVVTLFIIIVICFITCCLMIREFLRLPICDGDVIREEAMCSIFIFILCVMLGVCSAQGIYEKIKPPPTTFDPIYQSVIVQNYLDVTEIEDEGFKVYLESKIDVDLLCIDLEDLDLEIQEQSIKEYILSLHNSYYDTTEFLSTDSEYYTTDIGKRQLKEDELKHILVTLD